MHEKRFKKLEIYPTSSSFRKLYRESEGDKYERNNTREFSRTKKQDIPLWEPIDCLLQWMKGNHWKNYRTLGIKTLYPRPSCSSSFFVFTWKKTQLWLDPKASSLFVPKPHKQDCRKSHADWFHFNNMPPRVTKAPDATLLVPYFHDSFSITASFTPLPSHWTPTHQQHPNFQLIIPLSFAGKSLELTKRDPP